MNLYVRNTTKEAEEIKKQFQLGDDWLVIGLGYRIVGRGFDKIVVDVDIYKLTDAEESDFRIWIDYIKTRFNTKGNKIIYIQ